MTHHKMMLHKLSMVWPMPILFRHRRICNMGLLTRKVEIDQFVIRSGSDTEVLWNDATQVKDDPVYKRPVHRQGPTVRGDVSTFNRLVRYAHPQVKLLLEMLVKKCGLEAVKEVMPEEHMKLLMNIRKTKERNERKYAANTEETKSRLSKATTSRMSRWNHTKIFFDFGDEETDNGNSDDMDTKTFSGRHSLPNSKKNLYTFLFLFFYYFFIF